MISKENFAKKNILLEFLKTTPIAGNIQHFTIPFQEPINGKLISKITNDLKGWQTKQYEIHGRRLSFYVKVAVTILSWEYGVINIFNFLHSIIRVKCFYFLAIETDSLIMVNTDTKRKFVISFHVCKVSYPQSETKCFLEFTKLHLQTIMEHNVTPTFNKIKVSWKEKK